MKKACKINLHTFDRILTEKNEIPMKAYKSILDLN